MSVFLGSNQIKQIYLGSNKVSKMYLGSNFIYGGATLTYNFMPDSKTEAYLTSVSNIPADGIVSVPEQVLIIDSDEKPFLCSVVGIGYQAFAAYSSIKQVILPETLKYIDASAFYLCSGLQKINIPGFVEAIGHNYTDSGITTLGYTFDGCKNLSSVTFDNTSGWIVKKTGENPVSISPSDLKNTAIAATYLNTVYMAYRWEHN